jgi:ketosteroid isomerase-like protein
MNLPNVVTKLVKAQDNYDSTAYANCFSETAVVFDEGHTYNGKTEIKKWIAEANEKFKIVMKPINFTQTETTCILTAEVAGSFDGSPVILNYHFELKDGLIQSLKIMV